jgi:GNAT superfamily N-acetyltransferase
MKGKGAFMDESNFKIRSAVQEDIPLILEFIRKLAKYENLSDKVTADEDTLNDSLFKRRSAEVIIGEENKTPVAFALFFHNFSTFVAKHGLYLEDLFVEEQYRAKGYGKAMLQKLAQIAVQRGCARLEWWCLDWNKPAIKFYTSIGAEAMDDWTVYRMDGDTLEKFSEKQCEK